MKSLKLGLVAVVIAVLFSSCGYNKMVSMDEQVTSQWAQVENVYQRRADLIPNLVNTVKGYAEHEKETLEGVIEARSKATAVNIDPTKLTPESLQQFHHQWFRRSCIAEPVDGFCNGHDPQSRNFRSRQ